ncbi:hypothetical protein EBU99_11950 [bacterium]|nr:hypothetical protein [bacterium]
MSGSVLLPTRPLEAWLHHKGESVPIEFLTHFLLQFQSNHTRRNYARDIESFFLFWRERNCQLADNLNTITEKHILLWLEQFKESATRSRRLASLSSFFNFCVTRKHCAQNPCKLIKRPKVSNAGTAQALSEEEVAKLLTHLQFEALQKEYSCRHAQRQKKSAVLRFAVLHTLFCVGMRVDELCELRMSDLLFTPNEYRLRFVTKGGEEHTALVSSTCAEVINFYIQSLRPVRTSDDYVFVRVQEGQATVKLSQTAVFQMIRSSAWDAGINKTLSPHSARATVATVLHRQGVPLGFIQSLLNHNQITTTAHYVKKANERGESASLKAPVAQWLNTSRKKGEE